MLLFGGDLALHRLPSGEFPAAAVTQLRGVFEAADLAMLNLETQLTEIDSPAGTIGSVLRADPGRVAVLTALGVSVVSCANNHCLDYGGDALLESVGRLGQSGIGAVGVVHDGSAGSLVMPARALRVGLLAFTDDWRVEGELPGTARPVPHHPAAVRQAIAAMARTVDIVVTQLHWGYEWAMYPLRSYRDLARSYVEAGAHLVVCHHAHVPMGLEMWQGGLIAHGLGNFYFGAPGREQHPFRSASFLLRVEVRAGAVVRAEALPVRTSPAGLLTLDEGLAGAGTLSALGCLSRRLTADRYLDRVEAALASERAAGLLSSLAQGLAEGNEPAVRERVRNLTPPRQRHLTASLQAGSGPFRAAGALLEAFREGALDPLTAAGRREIAALEAPLKAFHARHRPVGRLP